MWVAWWTAPPAREPFRKPDAFSGGARSHEEALAQARRAAGGAAGRDRAVLGPGVGARAPRSTAVGRPRGGGRQQQRPRAVERPLDHGDDERREGHHDLDLGDARHHRARNGRRPEARISSARSRHPPRSGRRCGGLPPGAARVQGGPAPDRPPPPHAHPGAVMALLATFFSCGAAAAPHEHRVRAAEPAGQEPLSKGVVPVSCGRGTPRMSVGFPDRHLFRERRALGVVLRGYIAKKYGAPVFDRPKDSAQVVLPTMIALATPS